MMDHGQGWRRAGTVGLISGRVEFTLQQSAMVGWCSWLSRQSNTLKVSGSSPGLIMIVSFLLMPFSLLPSPLSLFLRTM